VRLFLDTSSLIKLYYTEVDTENLNKIFIQNTITQVFLSTIAITEFYSGIYKKVRVGDLSLKNASDILTSFSDDSIKYTFIDVDIKVIETSKLLLEKYGVSGLRVLDALQFAAIYNFKDIIDVVVCNDKLLNSFLSFEGIQVF
jgi:predicted nucleic acid-binding protein